MTGCVHPVKDGEGLWRASENAAMRAEKRRGEARFGRGGCETGYPRGFSQLTFATEGGEYMPSGFPLSHSQFPSRCRLGMNETCEEKL